MKRIHDMPFGCVPDPAGARFRLWAPGAACVEVETGPRANGPVRRTPLAAVGEGWYEARIAGAAAGDRYAYVIDRDVRVPDPASRFNPDDVHGASEIVDPFAFAWTDDGWHGRPWHEAAICEVHVGTFSPEGDFAGMEARLDHFAKLGVTALELMPVADWRGRWNWGYDGVLPFAPDSRYGRPEALKSLVQAAHHRGLMVLLDVVYNHFGPEGNYLHRYAPQFFTDRHRTPWGAAIDFDGPDSGTVREFFIHNALYWLEEYHLDGLRLDAVHAIMDDSARHVVDELAARVRRGPGASRHVHLILENDANQARFLRGPAGEGADAQWNDDLHHAAHVLLTGEQDGYYGDYADAAGLFARCLAEGFGYQGEPSPYRGGERRGEPSASLAPTAFVNFLQTHDQVGNRAFGERLVQLADPAALRAVAAAVFLAPSPVMLFMGEEMGAAGPFLYFCDYEGELARAVTEGRRGEFARFAAFSREDARDAIPDPNAASTFLASRLDWEALAREPHAGCFAFHRELLRTRAARIVPLVPLIAPGRTAHTVHGARGVSVRWTLVDRRCLALDANLGSEPLHGSDIAGGEVVHRVGIEAPGGSGANVLPPWSALWRVLAPPGADR